MTTQLLTRSVPSVIHLLAPSLLTVQESSKPRPRYGIGKASNTKPFPYQRKIKVHGSDYEYQYKASQVHPDNVFANPVPWINIKGYWLKQAGFDIDMPLLVEVSEGKIVVTVAPL